MNWCDVEYAVTVVSTYHSYNIKKKLFNKPHYDFQVTQLTAILLDSNSSQNGIYWLHMNLNMSQMLRHMMILMTVIMRSCYNVTVVTLLSQSHQEKKGDFIKSSRYDFLVTVVFSVSFLSYLLLTKRFSQIGFKCTCIRLNVYALWRQWWQNEMYFDQIAIILCNRHSLTSRLPVAIKRFQLFTSTRYNKGKM